MQLNPRESNFIKREIRTPCLKKIIMLLKKMFLSSGDKRVVQNNVNQLVPKY